MKGLSPQQRRIADLMMEGLSNKEIAYELNMSYGTVKTHIWWLGRKLKQQTRVRIILTLLRDAGRLIDIKPEPPRPRPSPEQEPEPEQQSNIIMKQESINA